MLQIPETASPHFSFLGFELFAQNNGTGASYKPEKSATLLFPTVKCPPCGLISIPQNKYILHQFKFNC